MTKFHSPHQSQPLISQKKTHHVAGFFPAESLLFQNNRLHFHKFLKPMDHPDPAGDKSSSDRFPEVPVKKEA